MNRPILTPAECRLYPNKKGCELFEDFTFVAVDGKTYTIPAPFWCDGGSIPKMFWQVTFSPFDMDVIDEFIKHDWFYTSHTADKKIADATLNSGLTQKGATVKAALVDKAVKLFGESSWKLDATDRLYMRSLRKTIIESGRNPADYCL